MRFYNVIREVITTQANEDNEFIKPPWLFEVKKKIVIIVIRYCLKNESSYKQFTKKLDDKFDDVQVKWLTKKVKTLFRVRDKSL